MNPPLSRRAVLRGLGTAVALPFLESMFPARLFGAETAAKAAAGPRRIAWLYVPNGVHMENWKPSALGADFELPPTLDVLSQFKSKMTVVSGLVCDKANGNGDGPGDHARAQAAYLTGAQPRKTEGAGIKSGISADQLAAEKVGHLTKFASLELGLEEASSSGRCDSGYSCAYVHNLSWRNDTTPVIKECHAQAVFDRLFSNFDPRESAEMRARRENDRKSVLDFVLHDAGKFQRNLASTDRQKVDEYLTAVREIEVRLQRASTEVPPPVPEGAERPEDLSTKTKKGNGEVNSSDNYPERAKLMLDMMVLAFQTDLTRIITFPFADEGSNQAYPWADANVAHHGTSHHQNKPENLALIAKINVFHAQQVAYLLEKLDKIQEGNGSILDNSIIAYGSGNSDGNRHNHDDLPLVLLGKGGGTLAGGRHIQVNNDPINNLWLSMIERVGASASRLGDSTGKFALS